MHIILFSPDFIKDIFIVDIVFKHVSKTDIVTDFCDLIVTQQTVISK